MHATAAFGLEALGRERHLVGRIGEAFKIELDVALPSASVVASPRSTLWVPRFCFASADRESVVLEFGERKLRGARSSLACDAALARRRAVEIAQRHHGLDAFGSIQPRGASCDSCDSIFIRSGRNSFT